jgi:hypothetical protein
MGDLAEPHQAAARGVALDLKRLQNVVGNRLARTAPAVGNAG